MNEDPFRYCVFCGADCYKNEPEHATDCPSSTGVYPVRSEKHCPTCSCDGSMRCAECDADLKVGDHYMHREIDPADELIPGLAGAATYECICLGCALADAV